MKALIINPPGDYIIGGARWASKIWGNLKYTPFPFHMAYAASNMTKKGHKTALIDCVALKLSRPDLYFVLKEWFDVIGMIVMETSAPSYKQDLETAKHWKGEIPTVIIGHHGTAEYKKIVEDYDYVILGEYDETLVKLADYLEGKRKTLPKGVATSQNKNNVQHSPLIKDINRLPWPQRHDVSIYAYSEPVCFGKNIVLVSSRGCHWNCMYCTVPLFYGKVCLRLREPKDIVDEMEYLWYRFKPDELYFDDDSFASDEDHVFAICDEIEKRNTEMVWGCMCDARISNECIERLSQVGCRLIKIGAETIHQEILNKIPKPISKQDISRVTNKCKEVGIRIHLDWVLGLPGSTAELDRQTIEYNEKMNPSSCQFSVFTPYPGTRAYEMCRKNGWLIGDDWDMFNASGGVVVSYPQYSNEEIQRVFWKAVTDWKKSLLTKRWKTLWHHIYGDYKRYGMTSTMSLLADQIKQVVIRR